MTSRRKWVGASALAAALVLVALIALIVLIARGPGAQLRKCEARREHCNARMYEVLAEAWSCGDTLSRVVEACISLVGARAPEEEVEP